MPRSDEATALALNLLDAAAKPEAEGCLGDSKIVDYPADKGGDRGSSASRDSPPVPGAFRLSLSPLLNSSKKVTMINLIKIPL